MCTRKLSRIAALAIGTVMMIGSAYGQTAPARSHQLAYPVDSGRVQNNQLIARGIDAMGDVIGDGAPSVVFVQEIDVKGAQWLRLQFDQVLLAGDEASHNRSYLVITSMWDGASQRLYAQDVHNWNNTSAYLNGGTLIIELYAHPGSGPNRFLMSELTVGEVQPGGFPIESICGTIDDRTLSQDNRQGRIWPVGCTGWMIEDGNFGNRFLTAGHCIQNNTANAIVEFNVPLSSAGGSAQHPPPSDQWSVPAGQINSNGGQGIGNDYAQFFTAVNGTGLTPREANGGGAYRLAATAPAVAGQSIRITGYGSTTTQPNTPLSWSLVQKSHTGPFVLNSGTIIRYATDTSGGNSGSPVVDVTGGGLAIGIHTNAGCTANGGSNQGTDISHAGLQGFLANPAGTGIAMNVNCVTTLFGANNGGSNGGAVYFDIVTGATAVRLTGFQVSVDAPAANFGAPFTMEVFTVPGTFAGKETSAALWTSMANGTGTVGQRDSASMVTLGTTVSLPANSTTGIALVLGANTGHNYTNGTGSNQSYTDGTITVNLGSSSNVPFTAGIFSPRVFNGSICYEEDSNSIQRVFPTTGHAASNFVPFASGTTTMHQVFDAQLFANKLGGSSVANITDIAFSPGLTGTFALGSVEIKLGYTNLNPLGLALPSAGTNPSGPMTRFFFDRSYVIDITASGSEEWGEMIMSGSFDYEPALGNLLVEIIVPDASLIALHVSRAAGSAESSRAYDTTRFGNSAANSTATRMQFTFAGGSSCPCACNMDVTTGIGVCDLFDFLAFQGGFVAGETCQCDIDTSTGVGVCDLFDFLAFQGAFVAGCP